MAGGVTKVLNSWAIFTPAEKKNITVYILGIMLYKFGLEAFNGSIIALATNRYDFGGSLNTLERIGLLTGLNQAFQCVGSILIAPLIRRYPTKVVLSSAIFLFGLCTAVLLIVDAATGGKIVPKGWHKANGKDDFTYYGDYNTDAIIPIYCVAGIVYGMVELIRRIVPRDIVGGNVQKLRRMDALVHIFYEVAGTSGAFCTALALIPRLGNNYSFIITPIFFTAAAAMWLCLNIEFTQEPVSNSLEGKPSYFKSVFSGAILFFDSVYTGGKILFSSRKFIWLLPGYSIALYAHRYLENGVAPQIAKRYLGHSAWAQIMVGGSNFGELLGALFVFLFTNFIKTPIPWLRLDALVLMVVWYIPFWTPPTGTVKDAWMVAATFLPVSFGWAAGDVSLAAYIQAALARMEGSSRNVSSLGAVMAFLYSVYIVLYAITSPLLGRYLDGVYARSGGKNGGDIREGLKMTAGVQFTIISVLILLATLVPKGAFALNPDKLFDENLDEENSEGKEIDDDQKSEKMVPVVCG
ncbi:major facilitator superfamily domain-containing protein [Pyronema omphalodes]|nr:major facilitator superfamily domain-containing protein [Pyronema omphalodes]KAI5810352.1 major facilitator superfamily domain-containing protein [Pyronema omphalodes]